MNDVDSLRSELKTAAQRFLALHRNPYAEQHDVVGARNTLRAAREAYALAIRPSLRRTL